MNATPQKIQIRHFTGHSRNSFPKRPRIRPESTCNHRQIPPFIGDLKIIRAVNPVKTRRMGEGMQAEPAALGIALVEAYARSDISSVVEMMSFPFAIYLGTDLLVLNNLRDAANLSTVYKQLVFRGKVRGLRCSLIASNPVSQDGAVVDLRFHHDVVGKAKGHAASGRFYFRMIDGEMKSEMLELIDYDPTGPFALAFGVLKSPAANPAELAI